MTKTHLIYILCLLSSSCLFYSCSPVQGEEENYADYGNINPLKAFGINVGDDLTDGLIPNSMPIMKKSTKSYPWLIERSVDSTIIMGYLDIGDMLTKDSSEVLGALSYSPNNEVLLNLLHKLNYNPPNYGDLYQYYCVDTDDMVDLEELLHKELGDDATDVTTHDNGYPQKFITWNKDDFKVILHSHLDDEATRILTEYSGYNAGVWVTYITYTTSPEGLNKIFLTGKD